MAVECKAIVEFMERLAPIHMAEKWDNVGLQLGDPLAKVSRILVAVDPVEEVVREAVEKRADMIITHHPFFFDTVKTLRQDTATGRIAALLIKNGISLYCAHTNLDNAPEGINQHLAELLDLRELMTLEPLDGCGYHKIVVFVPAGHEDRVAQAMSEAGTGRIGNYSHCSFRAKGVGTFMPGDNTDPFIGQRGELERVEEYRVETIVPSELTGRVVREMLAAHPYEEAAYDIYSLQNGRSDIGAGRVGLLPQAVSLGTFVQRVKKVLDLTQVRCLGSNDMMVRRIAVCGGSGASLIDMAAAMGADVFLTGDIKHHDALKSRGLGLALIDAGHYGTEKIAADIIKAHIDNQIKGTDMEIEVIKSQISTHPFIIV